MHKKNSTDSDLTGIVILGDFRGGRCGSLWLVIDRCGFLWLVVAFCVSLWLVVACCESLWLVVARCIV